MDGLELHKRHREEMGLEDSYSNLTPRIHEIKNSTYLRVSTCGPSATGVCFLRMI